MSEKIAKPFLKWAGGKMQLINAIKESLPLSMFQQKFTYVESFVGSGAVFFWMLNNFPNLQRVIINDINADLINVYKVIAEDVEVLISKLDVLQTEWYNLVEDTPARKVYYYQKRALYNLRTEDKITQASLFIFLNRVCFNGLYRVNRKNEFNVPMGSYKKPLICDENNLKAVNIALQKVEILCGDYSETINYASKNTFFYFDPPYKPLNNTSAFNTYSKDGFNDDEQIRLRDFCADLDKSGHKWMLSNSDVKESDPSDSFFDDIYDKYTIVRVRAKRSINSNPTKRGTLSELIITNY